MRLKKKDLPGLRAEIKRLADEGRAYHSRIRAARGPERHALRMEKKDVGEGARVLLLAYALLRGVPYRALEARCREDVDGRGWLVSAVRREAGRWAPDGVQDEAVEAWFGAEAPGEAAA